MLLFTRVFTTMSRLFIIVNNYCWSSYIHLWKQPLNKLSIISIVKCWLSLMGHMKVVEF